MIDIIIIGGGPAGLTAALYALRYGLSVMIFEKMLYGGQVATTPDVENYPAIDKISGFDFSQNLHKQIKALNPTFINEDVISTSLKGDIKIVNTSKTSYQAKTVIVATGAKRRLLGCTGEEKFTGLGVGYCATCDGNFFRLKDVAMIGGGNTALEDALFLSNLCNKVYLIHRRDEFRAMKSLVSAVKSRENIEIIYSANVSEIIGDKSVNSIKLDNNNIINVSGVFIAVGTLPDNEIVSKEINLDSNGYIISDENCHTNIQGVFVAGDGRTKHLRQIVTATSDGACAAFAATNFINTNS